MIAVELPDVSERTDVLSYYLGKLRLGNWDQEAVDDLAEKIARITPGESPAYLENLINEAAIMNRKINRLFERYKSAGEEEKGDLERMIQHTALHRVVDARKKDFISRYATKDTIDNYYLDVREVIEIQHMGYSHPEKERKFEIKENTGTTATVIHEVGHALVAFWNGVEAIDFITTIPRGNAKGYVRNVVDRRMETKKDFIVRIKQALAGRAAEEVFYGKDNVSTGASQDIRNATSVARAMFGMFGFSDDIGMMSVYENRTRYINGDLDYTCSDAMRNKLDQEVSDTIKALYQEVVGEIKDHKEEVEYMAKLVFEKESMSGEDFKNAYLKFKEKQEA
ncbi:MAG: hypothetical protein ACI4F4_05955 [Lachnospiraceae bacterium]